MMFTQNQNYLSNACLSTETKKRKKREEKENFILTKGYKWMRHELVIYACVNRIHVNGSQ